MGVYAEQTVHGQLVMYDSAYTWRWLDAYGPAVNKWIEEFTVTNLQAANALGPCTVTLVNATTVANVAGSDSGEIIITAAGADNDGANIQLNGEAFKFNGNLPLYFGIRFKASEATQSDFLVGMAITDTDALGGLTDGVYFRKVDASTSVSFVVEKDSTESTVAVQTFAANTYNIYEFYYDGTNIYAYINGTLAATVAGSATNVPNDEYLTPTIHFLAGEAAAHTCTIDWVRAIQITAG